MLFGIVHTERKDIVMVDRRIPPMHPYTLTLIQMMIMTAQQQKVHLEVTIVVHVLNS